MLEVGAYVSLAWTRRYSNFKARIQEIPLLTRTVNFSPIRAGAPEWNCFIKMAYAPADQDKFRYIVYCECGVGPSRKNSPFPVLDEWYPGGREHEDISLYALGDSHAERIFINRTSRIKTNNVGEFLFMFCFPSSASAGKWRWSAENWHSAIFNIKI